jgi:hypothetical protein
MHTQAFPDRIDIQGASGFVSGGSKKKYQQELAFLIGS